MNQKNVSVGHWLRPLLLAAVMIVPVAASAQTTISSTDVQRLQDDVYQASSDLSRLRSSNPETASRLQAQLDELREDVIYLKVKLRKEGNVPRADYADVRDRLQAFRSGVRGETTDQRGGTEQQGAWRGGTSGGTSGGTTGGTYGGTSGGTYGNTSGSQSGADRGRTTQSSTGAIPSGQEIDARLQSQLSSSTAQVEDRFEATTLADLYRGNEVLIPAGSVMRGVVRTVERATRTDRKGQLTVSFDQITIRGRTYPMRGTVSEALESEGIKGEGARIGAGAGVGAIIGGILGGVKGALLGVLIGGGGTIAATEGKDVTLEPGTILRVSLDTPPNIR
ncbi:MAG: hypothetical protein H0W08_17120 [Acidobacteria bacterium]|nr:hypothetical protein [Acidobacteriota bacterium]